jgi:hypothetical protein
MDFRFDDEATAIADLAGTVLADYSAPEQLRELERSGAPRLDRDLWGKLAETGILGAFVPESAGGAGLGLLALGAALEQAGRTTAAVPLWETLALGALPIAAFAPEALANEVLGAVAAVHVVEITNEEGGLLATGAGSQLHDAPGAVGVVVVTAELGELVPFEVAPRLQLREFGGRERPQLLIVTPAHLHQVGDLLLEPAEPTKLARQLDERPVLAGHGREPLLVGEHRRIGHGTLQFLEPGELLFQLVAHALPLAERAGGAFRTPEPRRPFSS